MSPEIFNEMQTETSGEFGGLGIEVGMEAGVVKVISPIDDTPASEAGIKAGDYIVKINNTQVQGKSLSEAVELMRGPVGSGIELTVRRSGEKKALIFNIRNNRTLKEYKYVGTRVKLNRPEVVMMNNRKVNFNYKNIVTLHKDYYHNMKGGFKGLDKLSHITNGFKESNKFDHHRMGYPIKVCYSMPNSESLLGCHD